MNRKNAAQKRNSVRSSRSVREARANYATNSIALSSDLVSRIDDACRELAITREEFLSGAVLARLSATRRADRMPNPQLQTREEIQTEWERKKPFVKAALKASYGAWANRDDLGDTARWVRKLRRESGHRLKRLGIE